MGPKQNKPKPKNDYYFFMEEQKKVLQAQGIKYRGMKELADLCGPKWRQLGEAERSRFKAQATRYKEQTKGPQFDSAGRDLEMLEAQKVAEETLTKKLNKDLKDCIDQAINNRSVQNQQFYFMHMNSMCKVYNEVTEQDEHLPCEIALSEYSLAEGVSRVLHGYVYPPCIPKGYGYEILRTAQDTHLLNEDSELLKTHAAKDYRNIVDEIVKFLRIRLGGVNGPKIFTFKEEIKAVNQMLSNLFYWAECDFPRSISLHPTHELLHLLSTSLPRDATIDLDHANTIIRENPFQFSTGQACDFHEEEQRHQYCSMYHVQNWAFAISDRLNPFFRIHPIPGRHVPGPNQFGDGPVMIQTSHDADLSLHSYDRDNFNPVQRSRFSPSSKDSSIVPSAQETRSRPAGFTKASNTGITFSKGASNLLDDFSEMSLTSPGEKKSVSRISQGAGDNDEFPSLGASVNPSQPRGKPSWGRGSRGRGRGAWSAGSDWN